MPSGGCCVFTSGMAKATQPVVAITGVTRGLGRALLTELDARGCIVAGCGRSQEALNVLKAKLPERHCFQAVDVADRAGVDAWAKAVIEKVGTPDFLINNAALMNHPAPLWEVPQEEFTALLDVNIRGVYQVIRAFTPALIAAKNGVIVNLSSGWGRTTGPNVAPYCTTKWAIEGMTQALSQELPSGLAAVALNPGIINTDMLQICFTDEAASYETAEQWAPRAAHFILGLSAKDNGKALTV